MIGRNFRSSSRKSYLNELVGTSNEATLTINSIPTIGLLDTGSAVSILNISFYDEHLSELQIQPIQDLLSIECTDGNELSYDGFIETDISMKANDNSLTNCLLLIVPDSKYNAKVPVLLGTNVLTSLIETLQDKYGDKYLQDAKLIKYI